MSRNHSLLVCGLISWSDISLKGDDLLDRRMERVHAEDIFDLMLLLPNSVVALP